MPTRSGQLDHLENLTVACLACDWYGHVEAHIDGIRNDCWWVCPACTTETLEEWISA
jgi:hypothetical protein